MRVLPGPEGPPPEDDWIHPLDAAAKREPIPNGDVLVIVMAIGTSDLAANARTRRVAPKLLAGTRQRFSGFSHIRQCSDDVLRIFVTGGPPVRGGGGMPHRIIAISRPPSVLRITAAG